MDKKILKPNRARLELYVAIVLSAVGIVLTIGLDAFRHIDALALNHAIIGNAFLALLCVTCIFAVYFHRRRREIRRIYQENTELKEWAELHGKEKDDDVTDLVYKTRLLIDHSRDGMLIVDNRLRVVFWNKRALDVMGYSSEDVLGKSLLKFMSKGDYLDYLKHLPSFILSGKSKHIGKVFTSTITAKGGAELHIEISASSVRIGGKWYAIVNARDVTDRFKVESRYKSLFESAGNAIVLAEFSKDSTPVIVDVNRRAEEMFKATRRQLLGKTPFDLAPKIQPNGESSAEIGARVFPSIQQGKTLVTEIVQRRFDGTDFETEVTLSRVEIDGKQMIQSIIRDVSEKRATERLIKAERDRARLYLNLVNAVVVAVGSDGKVDLINRRGAEVLGYKEDEIVGRDWFANFLPKRFTASTREVFDKMMAGEVAAVEVYENPILTSSGEERDILWHNTIIRDAQGKIIETLGAGDDITEQKNIEKERSKFTQFLTGREQDMILLKQKVRELEAELAKYKKSKTGDGK